MNDQQRLEQTYGVTISQHHEPQRMLVVLAHPDDESFPLGGTLAKYAAAGVEITLVCATKGEAGIPGLPPRKSGLFA